MMQDLHLSQLDRVKAVIESGEVASAASIGIPKASLSAVISQLRKTGAEIASLGNGEYQLADATFGDTPELVAIPVTNGNGNGHTAPDPGRVLHTVVVTISDGHTEWSFPIIGATYPAINDQLRVIRLESL